MYVEFITPPDNDPEVDAPTAFDPRPNRVTYGVGVYNELSLSWIVSLAFNGVTVGSAELYLEQVAGQCYMVLQSDILGFPVGSELRWETTGTSEDCRKLTFVEEITGTGVGTSTAGTIRVSGGQFLEIPTVAQCFPQCCVPYVCYQVVVNGTVEVYDTSATGTAPSTIGSANFQATVLLNDSEVYNLPYVPPPYPSLCNLEGVADAELDDVLPCVDGVIAPATGESIVSVGALIYGNTLYLQANTKTYASARHDVRYAISPSLKPGDICSERTLSLLPSQDPQPGLAGDQYFGLCFDTTDSSTAGIRVTISSVSTLAVEAGTSCVQLEGECARRPPCFVFIVRGVTDDACTECETFNQLYILHRQLGTCTYYGTSFISGLCLSYYGAASGRWVGVLDPDTNGFVLEFVLYDVNDEPIGVVVSYTTTVGTDGSTVFVLSYVSAVAGCLDWPAEIFMEVCNDVNRSWGACCVAASYVCDNMTEQECTSISGTFLGNGTRCWLEGCTLCSIACNTFCDEYSLAMTFSVPACWVTEAVDMTCVLVRNGSGGGDCTWYFTSSAGWTLTLTVDTSVSPPTRTLVGAYVDPMDPTRTINFTAVGQDAYCEAENVLLLITAWSSANILCAQPTTYSILLTQSTGCPGFLPA